MNYLRILSAPDEVRIQEAEEWISARNDSNEWIAGNSCLGLREETDRTRLEVRSGNKGVKRLYLRWCGEPVSGSLFMGRSVGAVLR